jgi:hypothetical protein
MHERIRPKPSKTTFLPIEKGKRISSPISEDEKERQKATKKIVLNMEKLMKIKVAGI